MCQLVNFTIGNQTQTMVLLKVLSVCRDMDPQFVVTLNGYDPDGLYSQSELDIDLEGDNDDWLRESGGQDPLLTSTPDQTVQRQTSPNGPAVNHSSTYALFI